jgi:PHD/YefM family antitoxin component YafN of YafNO toxin-antitoxin module
MPEDVKDVFGHAIDLSQAGGKHQDAKVMAGFGPSVAPQHGSGAPWASIRLPLHWNRRNIQAFFCVQEITMSIHTFSSRDFTRDVSAAKRAAVDGPVFITDRGRPAFALLKIDDYYRMAGQSERSLLDVMDAIPGGEGIDFDPPRLHLRLTGTSLE